MSARRRLARRLRHGCGLGVRAIPLLFFSGVFGDLVTGYVAGGLRSGLWHGLFLGLGVAALLAGLGVWVLSSPAPQPYPGAGMALVVWWLVAALLGVEVVVDDLIGGGLGRFSGR